MRFRLDKKFVRYGLILIAAFTLIITAFSCSPKKKVSSDKIRLEFWTIDLKLKFTPYIEGMIAEYEREHSGVEIEWIDMPIKVVQQKFMASVAAGAPPDVVNLNSTFAQVLAQNYALVSMDDAVPPDKKALYFEGIWNAASFEGKNYAIPWYVTTKITMYNREIFEKASLDPDTPPKSWEEVDRFARQITENTGIYGYIPAIKPLVDLQVQGVPIVSPDHKTALFNCEEGYDALNWFISLKKAGVMPDETLTEGYHGALNRFQGGKLGILIAAPTLLKRMQKDAPTVYKNVGVGPMPLGKAGVIPASTMNLVVPRSTKHRKEAVDFALFITNDKNQLAFAKLAPIVPSTKKAADDEFFRKGVGDPLQDKAIAISIEQLKKSRDLSLGLKHSFELNRAIKEAFESAFYGRMTPKEALDEAARRWNEILDR